MKTIAELQQEIRSIRKEINSIDKRLEAMDSELLNYKDSVLGKSEYSRLYQIAKTMPIIKHPIVHETIAVKTNYFGVLLMLSVVDDSINEDQLLFLQRMIMTDVSCQHLEHYLSALGSIIPENVLYKLDENISEKYCEQLMLDMLILTNLSHGNTHKAYEVIVSIASIMGMNKGDMQKIAMVAATILKWDGDSLGTNYSEVIRVDETFGYYLQEIPRWKEKIRRALIEKMIIILLSSTKLRKS